MINIKHNINSIFHLDSRHPSPLWNETLSFLPVRSMYVLKAVNKSCQRHGDMWKNAAILLQLEKFRSIDLIDLIVYGQHSLNQSDKKEMLSSKVCSLIPHCKNLEAVTVSVVSLFTIRRQYFNGGGSSGRQDKSSDIEKIIKKIAEFPIKTFKVAEMKEAYGNYNYFLSDEIEALLTLETLTQLTLSGVVPSYPNEENRHEFVTFFDKFYKISNLQEFAVDACQYFYSNHFYKPVFNVEDAKKISGLHHLHTLNLELWDGWDEEGVQGISEDALKQLSEVPNITSLTLPGNGLRDTTIEKILALSHLEELKIIDRWLPEHLTTEGCAHLAGCVNLKSLDIIGATVNAERAKIIGDSLANLTRLRVKFSFQAKGEEEAAYNLIQHLQLTELGLSNFGLTDVFISTLVEELPSLTSLDISESLITSKSFATFEKLKKLIELNITGIRISPQELHLLANCKNLKTLHLSVDHLDVEHLQKTEFFKSFAALEKLVIDMYPIDPRVKSERCDYYTICRTDKRTLDRDLDNFIDKKLRKLMRSYPNIDVTLKYQNVLSGLKNLAFRHDRLGIVTKDNA